MTSSTQGISHIIATLPQNCKLFCLVFRNNKRKLICSKNLLLENYFMLFERNGNALKVSAVEQLILCIT